MRVWHFHMLQFCFIFIFIEVTFMLPLCCWLSCCRFTISKGTWRHLFRKKKYIKKSFRILSVSIQRSAFFKKMTCKALSVGFLFCPTSKARFIGNGKSHTWFRPGACKFKQPGDLVGDTGNCGGLEQACDLQRGQLQICSFQWSLWGETQGPLILQCSNRIRDSGYLHGIFWVLTLAIPI